MLHNLDTDFFLKQVGRQGCSLTSAYSKLNGKQEVSNYVSASSELALID